MSPELIEVVKRLKALNTEADKYLDKLPEDLLTFVYDNVHANCIGLKVDALAQTLFGEHYETVEWYLYEFEPSDSPQLWLADGTPVTLSCDEDFVRYLHTL